MYHGIGILSTSTPLLTQQNGSIKQNLPLYALRQISLFTTGTPRNYFASGALAGVEMMWSTNPYSFASSAFMK